MCVKSKHTLNRQILALSVPAVIATVTTPLLGLMDTAFTGHMGGAVYLAGIALGGNLFNMLYWLFGFLRMGTSGLTAQAVGARDVRRQWITLYRALAVAFIAGLVIILLQWPLSWLYRSITLPEPGAWREAELYFRILVWGAPATLATTAMSGWFVGMQSSKRAMWMSVAIDVANIAMSALLVIGVGMKVPGVAVGTLVAQWTGFAVALLLAFRMGHMPPVRIGDILEPVELRRFMTVNRDIFLRTLCMIAVTLWFTRAGASGGTVTLAANALLMQLFILFSYVLDGLAYAGEALAGKCAGARDRYGFRLTVAALMRWGAVVALLFTVVYFLCGQAIMSLLSDDAGVRAAAADYLPWAVAIPFCGFAAFTWDGIFIGATATRRMLAAMAVSAVVYFAVYFTLRHILGNHALWLAFVAFLLARSLSMTAMSRRII